MASNDTEATGPGTRAVWGGERPARDGEPTQVPVVHGVAFGYRDVDQWRAVAEGSEPGSADTWRAGSAGHISAEPGSADTWRAGSAGHIYGRNTNPTVAVLEEKLRLLEGAAAATCCATGMAAISSTLYTLLRPGRRVVSVTDTYGGTSKLFTEFLPRWDVDIEGIDTGDVEGIEAATTRGCDVLYLETPTNPTLKVLDLARLTAAGHAVDAVVVVDNTFATPINQRPLEHGADLVIHSATKFLGGHADALGGVVAGRADLVERIYHHREIHGASLDAMSAYLLLRGMKTLQLRIARQNASAQRVAEFLDDHPAVTTVNYPGLAFHPGHEVAARQMSGFGGVLSFGLHGDLRAVRAFVPALDHAHAAANLGAVETIVGPPATTSHVECSAEERARLGIPEGLIRYSTGIEDVDDLLAALERALAAD